jgi:hypothetical protein
MAYAIANGLSFAVIKTLIPIPTPTGEGAGGIMQVPNIPEKYITGLSTKAGGSGATHPVVRELYNLVPMEHRSLYHGKCAEASILSEIAYGAGVTTIEGLKKTVEGAISTVYNSKEKYITPCPSCRWVLANLGIVALKIR